MRKSPTSSSVACLAILNLIVKLGLFKKGDAGRCSLMMLHATSGQTMKIAGATLVQTVLEAIDRSKRDAPVPSSTEDLDRLGAGSLQG
jgi:hypothetical protein